MSTRATYEFKDKKAPTFCVYIHHDGYPDGAAAYFYNTLINPSKGNFATQFIRCNEGAELTKNHAQHGDTEYQYTIEGSGPEANIVVLKCQRCDFFTKTVQDRETDLARHRQTTEGPLWEFINENNQLIPDFKPFKLVQLQYNQQYLNEAMAENMLKLPLHHLSCWEGRHEGSANWNSCVQDARVLTQAFPELYSPDFAKYGIMEDLK